MVSKLEITIRKMDDQSKPLLESARKIAKKLGANVNTCRSYLSAKRNGYESVCKYQNHIVAENGYKSMSDYVYKRYQKFITIRKILRENKSDRINTESLDSMPQKMLDSFVHNYRKLEDEMLEELKERVNSTLESSVLTEKEKDVIKKRYYENMNFSEIAISQGNTDQRAAHSLFKYSLEKLRPILLPFTRKYNIAR